MPANKRMKSTARRASILAACMAALALFAASSFAQFASAPVAPTAALPEPVYWKQDLFLIPYQFASAAEPAAAQAVWLFVSKDRGISWQKISEAAPQVKAFNYRADGEGEYWFAIRTLDRQGRTWPVGPYQPELRVIVDTTIPRFEALRAQVSPNGNIDIAWLCSDLNLDPNSLVIEAQVDAAGNWQQIPLADQTTVSAGLGTSALGPAHNGQIQWQTPAGVRPIAIRATVADRARNSATYRSEISLVAANGIMNTVSAAQVSAPAAGTNTMFAPPAVNTVPPATAGWNSVGHQPQPYATPQAVAPPASQVWQATPTNQSPFRLSGASAATTNDGVTAYGSPPVTTGFSPSPAPVSQPQPQTPAPATAPQADRGAASPVVPHVEAHNASTQVVAGGVEQAPLTGPRFASLDPFRQPSPSSVRRLPAPAAASLAPSITPRPQSTLPVGPADGSSPVPPGTMRVGSRTFALEYDLDDTGRWGVSKVELWGTRDGGRSWHSFACDDDHRSPLVVTVDNEGLYGFRIAVESAGSAGSPPPNPGDLPELWVSVDLQRPTVALTAIERGEGNLSDQLVLRWKATDDNLEPRPIALFYSSRPTGPWSAIATNLEDTGEYAWRVDRFVPARFYLRIEARDTAGNLAAFQTREPVDFAPTSPSGHLRSVEPVGPTAAGPNDARR